MKLDDALRGVQVLGFDTAPLIYYVEAQPLYGPLVADVFARLERGGLRSVTSMVSWIEVLVKPILTNDLMLQEAYRELLLDNPHLELRNIDVLSGRRAAEVRSRYRLKPMDAIQVAIALEAGAQAFLTNDLQLQRVTELRVLALDELEL